MAASAAVSRLLPCKTFGLRRQICADLRHRQHHAEGEMQASEKLLQAAQVLAQSPQAMQLRYLQTLTNIATDKTTTIVFLMPMDVTDLLAKLIPEKRSGGR